MPRAPFQVLVILYRKTKNAVEYCVFERADPPGQLQFVAGGGEDDETHMQAAIRELREETGITDAKMMPLKSVTSIPSEIFTAEMRKHWEKDRYIIPEYAFGAEVGCADKITLSDEHVAYKWLTFIQAKAALKWDGNKTALYELNCVLS